MADVDTITRRVSAMSNDEVRAASTGDDALMRLIAKSELIDRGLATVTCLTGMTREERRAVLFRGMPSGGRTQ